ncbi:MAG: calcium-translocating P-type ATPase, PMCA-type [Oscillospiraceae bacterium]
MKEYFESTQEVLKNAKTTENGLTQAQVTQRIEEFGENKLAEGKKTSLFKRFLEQLKDPMIIILIIAAIISGITSAYSGEGFADVIIIMIVVIINAVLGVYQESKAEKAIEALQKMTSATSKVFRDGKLAIVKSEELTVGDVIALEAGDAIPADGRLIECVSLKIEEAALTGESVPVDKTDLAIPESDKDIPLGDRKNMMYMGSTVVYGRAKAVITSIGMNTEMGKIAGALSDAKDEKTPLQRKLSHLSKVLTYAVVGICAFIFLFNLIKTGDFSGAMMLDTFMIAVSLAVAAIPEGLATVVTIVLSIGVTKMSAKNAVIRKLTAVETLGCAQIICSDKTGTLTQNKMTVTDYYGEDELLLAKALSLCSDAQLNDEFEAVGEPTECALVNYAYVKGLNKTETSKDCPRVCEAPFDSVRKMMSTVHQIGNEFVQYTKGAPDEVLKCCTHILKSNEVVLMTDEDRINILSHNKGFADEALRVLAAASKTYSVMPSKDVSPKELENNLVFIGLVGMIDPVRPEVCAAIEECRTAGIRPIMITGDHRDTAIAIAKNLGIITDPSQAITGAQLDEMSDEEYEKNISNYSVYARVKPENKVRIVSTWKKKGFICAMTGDGVNDAPSIKNADIGIGMGITGTDVTKNVADMVLADDNFATIVGAVGEGRKIFDNIRKAIQFLLASNLSEVLSIFLATLMGFTILKPVHLLWINLITDTFPALALGMEAGEKDAMQRPPRDPKESIFARGLMSDVIYQGIMVSIITLASYFIGHFMESGVWEIANSADGMTMAFLTMSMAEIFHSFNMRSQTHSIFTLKKQNIYLWGAMLGSLLMTILVIYVPFLRGAFQFEAISFIEFIVAMLLAVSVIPIVEVVKFFKFRKLRAK